MGWFSKKKDSSRDGYPKEYMFDYKNFTIVEGRGQWAVLSTIPFYNWTELVAEGLPDKESAKAWVDTFLVEHPEGPYEVYFKEFLKD